MFLALREMKHAKLRYSLIGLIMVLIAWLVLFVSGLAAGLASDNAASLQHMNATHLVLQEESDHRLTRSAMELSALDEVRKIVGEPDSAALGVRMTTLTKEGETKKTDATFFAVDANGRLAPKITEGSMITNTTETEVVADASLKEEGFRLGDTIHDQATDLKYKIVGFTEGQSFSHSPVIFMNLKAWEQVQPKHGGAEAGPLIQAIALHTDNDTAAKIASELEGVEVITKADAMQGIPGYKEEQGSLLMMIAFLFVIAAFVLAVFFYVMTIQKMNQFGVLKAIGAKTAYLARNLIGQVLLLSLVSLVISIVLTYGVAYMLPASMPFDLSPMLTLGCSALFLVVALLGSLLSLYRVAKIDAIEAIGRAA
ncbi:ABC transporter permease [Paenibacillus sp. 1001270B_150601_E10]|uniref:ABC transporter permease n=1 Tax=Paenibacillus sp. 1001270B_150601_E10 TaxID=2787079 RepID=UPI00189D786C|nr:ABC transporter permease [Paenibacillus sp. 1001270B_150601_E10]